MVYHHGNDVLAAESNFRNRIYNNSYLKGGNKYPFP